MKNLVFFYPTIYNDGLKKTLELYTKYLNKNFKVVVVTNTLNSQNLKFANSKVKVINVKNAFLSKIKSVNEIICLIKIIKFFNKNSTVSKCRLRSALT